MQSYDVLIVGGGPAGSTCARELVQGGFAVGVLERDEFPRTKLCAGWITPEAVADLELDPSSYPHRFNTFDHLVMHIRGLKFRLNTVQHSIRRCELDDYLLKRSGAVVHRHTVREIAGDDGDYVIDGQYRARYLVGAGGTRCPVYRSLFRDQNPRSKGMQTTTFEHEFPYEWHDERCHLWFFRKGLPGYAWYVPKADGFLNCGVGGVAEALKDSGQDIKTHWHHHMDLLDQEGSVGEVQYAPKGYSYFLRDHLGTVRVDNAFIVGDAVGLATRDLGEGIGPAVASGRLAAQAILTGAEYSLEHLDFFSLPTMFGRERRLSKWLERFLRRRLGVLEVNEGAI
ncbi:MAG: NAD(P)/FAD-dependent oxidoreductase [Gammaproteobacteria bacterium]|nr:MAG: NAD(P)/FAD-dependent oxidoreductase [Gammaproteobacteria bacterium]